MDTNKLVVTSRCFQGTDVWFSQKNRFSRRELVYSRTDSKHKNFSHRIRDIFFPTVLWERTFICVTTDIFYLWERTSFHIAGPFGVRIWIVYLGECHVLSVLPELGGDSASYFKSRLEWEIEHFICENFAFAVLFELGGAWGVVFWGIANMLGNGLGAAEICCASRSKFGGSQPVAKYSPNPKNDGPCPTKLEKPQTRKSSQKI